MTDVNEVAGDQGPDFEEIQQREPDAKYPPLCVTVEGPVSVRELPAVDAQIVSRTLDTAAATKLVSPNEFRGRVVLVADGDIYLGRTKAAAEANSGKVPYYAAPLELHAPVEYWAKAVTGTVIATLILESWAR